MNSPRIVIVGGGAAGFFAALACAEAQSSAEILILEKTSQFLAKVKISGGGRCNVTHACFDPREFAARFPRGEGALIGPFHQFQARDTVKWFAAHGVSLKTESDGRMFPITDSSQTIVDCLLNSARAAGVKLEANCSVDHATRRADGRFEVQLSRAGRGRSPGEGQLHSHGPTSFPQRAGERAARAAAPRFAGSPLGPWPEGLLPDEKLLCDKLLLATGGCRTPALGQLAIALGHSLATPVPSLFTFHIATPWLRGLAGVSVGDVEVSVPGTGLRERGSLLATHWGLSGPAILRLSAWGARILHDKNYQFDLCVNWLPQMKAADLAREFQARRLSEPARLVLNSPIKPLPGRLWEQLVLACGGEREARWSSLSRAAQHQLVQQLLRTEFAVSGKSLNQDEFVTCGGVRLREVDFKKMESRLCPGLFFAGELLDMDGITGGFNFQAAWTTGWLAGRAMAKAVCDQLRRPTQW